MPKNPNKIIFVAKNLEDFKYFCFENNRFPDVWEKENLYHMIGSLTKKIASENKYLPIVYHQWSHTDIVTDSKTKISYLHINAGALSGKMSIKLEYTYDTAKRALFGTN